MKLWLLLVCFAITSIFAVGGNVIIVGGSAAPASLPQSAARKLDFDPAITANINAGSPSDGDAVSTLVDASSNAYSFTQGTGGNRFTYETNELNGKAIFRMVGDQKVVNTTATGIVAAGSAFTILAVAKVANYTSGQYRYLASFKGAANNDSPTWAYSNNGSYQDIFFGCNTTFLNARITSLTTTNWNWSVLTYNGSGGTTIGNYTAYNNGSSATLSSSASNAGTTNNVFGSYVSGSGGTSSYQGDVARFVVWNVVLSAGELTTLATYINQQYGL